MDVGRLTHYFPRLTAGQINLFNQLPELYGSWNQKINVISRKDIDQLFTHHILHSLSIAKFISFSPGTRVIDVGTGGGFPGIPLAIFFPEVEFLLVDSIGKKITVVNEIVNALGIKNVRAVQVRAEEIQERCDFIVSRAVAPIADIIQWTWPLIEEGGQNAVRNGWIFLKGGDLQDEINGVKQQAITVEISAMFEEDFFLGKKIVYIAA